ncbi:MAG TPA: AMP-binding protein, partial [Thermoanaerobaculia bacterium]
MSPPWQEAVQGASTLVEILQRRARAQGGETAYTFLSDGEEASDQPTFAEVDRKARAIAARLGEVAGGDGARALLLYPPGLDFVAGFLGCLYARVVAVPAYPPASRRHLPRLHAIARDARPAAVLAGAATLPKLRAAAAALPELASVAWLATDTVPEADWDGPPPAGDDLAFLQYTSGSTAAPKGVMVTHANLVHNERVIQRQTGHDESTVFVGWLPLYHDMGLIGNVLQPLYLGIRCVLMSPVAFLQKPARWLAAVSRYRGTTSGGPNFAYELCVRKVTAEERAGLDLSSWSLAFSGAEPVRAETLERFADAFADCGFRRQALYPCYGMAETTLMISGGRRAGGRRSEPAVITPVSAAALEQDRAAEPEGDDDVRRVVGCGRAGSDLEIVIADPATARRLDDGRVGEIWVAGPSVARGYWNLPEVSEKTFRARLAGESERGPFLRTGDLGFLSGGELYVTGRLKDLIIIRGRNHYPQDLEATAERSHPALRPGCGAAFSTDVGGEERLVIVHELDRRFEGDPAPVVDAVRAAVAEAHQVQVHEVVLIGTGTLPKTSSGKIQRRAALAEHRAGTLEVVGRGVLGGEAAGEVLGAELELDRAALLARAGRRPLVEAFLRDRFARLTRSAAAYVDPDRPLTAQGLDSLIAVELKNAVESRLGVHLPLTQLLEGPTIAEVASSVLAQLEAPEATERAPLAAGTAEENREHPPSYGQQALWYLHRLAPESAAYNIRGAARIDGELDVEALRRAAEALVRRHPALRTRFVEEGGEPRAQVDEAPAFDFRVHEGDARLAEEIHRPFDLEHGPVLRLAVYVLGPRRHLLALVVHHAVADFWSLGVLIRELGELYGGSVELEPLTLTYADFARWQRALIAGPEGERLWAYWRARLAGGPTILDLPTDRPRPPLQTFAGESRAIVLDAELTERLKRFSSERGATLFMT